jgi:methylenetetrahydrofolate dehydrogenase (NADP+)/methenyltetrahydrofolate cyclohydrolase
MTARIIDGKAFAATLRGRVGARVAALSARHGLVPGLAVVLVGEDPASSVYVRNKGEATKAAGMASFDHRLPADTSQADLLALVDRLNRDPAVHVINAGRLAIGRPGLVPCTPLGCRMLLEDALGPLRGLNAVVLGRSTIVGRPMAQLLLQADCTVTICHSRTADLAAECRRADVLVAAIGRPAFVPGDWIRPGATVIDVGINRVVGPDGKGRLVGDVDFDAAVAVAGAITPVPGGVGPMTIACLLANTVEAACRQAGVPVPGDAA